MLFSARKAPWARTLLFSGSVALLGSLAPAQVRVGGGGGSQGLLPETPTHWSGQASSHDLIVVPGSNGGGVAIREVLPDQHQARTGNTAQPDLPGRMLDVMLPYDADLSTVRIRVTNVERTRVGNFDVGPVGQAASYDMDEDEWSYPLEPGVQLDAEGRDRAIYARDGLWPRRALRVAGTGRHGKFRHVRLRFAPYRWNPVRRELWSIDNLDFLVSWRRSTETVEERLHQLSHAARLPDHVTFVNLREGLGWYLLQAVLMRDVQFDYIIITTQSVSASSTQLHAFELHKEALGLETIQVNVENIAALYPAVDPADSIREFLQDAYWAWSPTYVLLIGDPDPYDATDPGGSVGSVPMKMAWVAGSGASNNHPTDQYYAELTGNWDSDGDGFVGEYEDDSMCYDDELRVGRIPTEDVSIIDDVLERTMLYEDDSSSPPSYRGDVAFALSFSDTRTDGAYLGEQIETDPYVHSGFTQWNYYQAASSFSASATLTDGNLPFDWSNGDYGLVVWWGHGSSSGTSVGYSGAWDGELMASTSATALDASRPTFVIQISCSNAKPETAGNITHTLIQEQAVSCIAASRTSIYIVGKTSFGDNCDNASVGYWCSVNQLTEEPNGRATVLMRWYCSESTSMAQWKRTNLLIHNVYGDPSLRFEF